MTTAPSSLAQPDQPARPLTRNDYKTLSLSALGGALEFYDFIIFVFFATVVGKLFFPADMPEWLRLMQTFGIFAAGYLAALIPEAYGGRGLDYLGYGLIVEQVGRADSSARTVVTSLANARAS